MSRSALPIGHNSTGHPMIRSISIRNFRCFQRMEIDQCSQFNIIVGDSGSGKTALLEAIFLAMGESPEITARYRAQRGFPAQFQGVIKHLREALWEDVFFKGDLTSPIQITLSGNGIECRKLEILPGGETQFLPFDKSEVSEPQVSRDMVFHWTSPSGKVHTGVAIIEDKGLNIKNTGEDNPDNFYFHSGNQGSGVENASRYSSLSKLRQEHEFDEIIMNEFNWIKGVSLEVSGGSPLIYVDIDGYDAKLPINSISSGINKLVMFTLAILNSPDSVILIDEIENGLYYKRYQNYWRIISNIARKKNVQLFVTTHSKEMLEAILAASEKNIDDISLWRMDIGEDGPIVDKFPGNTFKLGIEYGQELR